MASKKKKKTKIARRDEFTVSFALNESELKSYYVACYLPTLIAWGILALAGAVVAIFSWILGLAVVLVCVAYVVIKWINVRKIYRTDLSRPNIFADCELTLDGEKWTMRTKKIQNPPTIEWMDMHEVRSLKRVYVFCMTPAQRALVPKRAFTAEQLAWMEREVVPVVKNAPALRAKQNRAKGNRT